MSGHQAWYELDIWKSDPVTKLMSGMSSLPPYITHNRSSLAQHAMQVVRHQRQECNQQA